MTFAQGKPHGHHDWWDNAEHVQQRETETLAELFGHQTGVTGATPTAKAAYQAKH